MANPILAVEIQYTPGVWTTATGLVSGATHRGKQRSLDVVSAGTMILTMDNSNRAFDPEMAGVLVRIGQKIRLRATWDAVTHDVFTGYIDRIIQRYVSPRHSVAILDCTDAVAKFQAAILDSPWAVSTRAYGPHAWYRLNEHIGAVAFDSSGAQRHAAIVGTPLYNEPSLLTYLDDPDAALTFPAPAAAYLISGLGFLPSTVNWTLEFLLMIPAAPAANQFLLYDVRFPKGFTIWVNSAGVLHAQVYDESNTLSATVSSPSSVCDGNIRLIQIVAAEGNTLKYYAGGIESSDNASGVAHELIESQSVIGVSPYQDTTLDEIATYSVAFTDIQVLTRRQDLVFWVEDLVNSRTTRVYNAIDWPLTDVSITAEGSALSGTLLSESALSHIEALMMTIGGRFWVTKSGIAKSLGRLQHLQTPYTVSQGTFGDAPGELGYESIADITRDNATLTNVVRRHNLGPYGDESSIVAFDQDSIDRHGRRDNNPIADVDSLYLFLDEEPYLAQYRVDHYKDPILYVDSLTFNPKSNPVDLWPQALGRELADRITLRRRPQGVGAMIEIETIVEGISHSITPQKWVTTFSIDATDARRYFLFDVTSWDNEDWRFA